MNAAQRAPLGHATMIGRPVNARQRRLMSDDYAIGRRDGLRLALAILNAEEEKWSALLGQSQSWRTNATREVRHKLCMWRRGGSRQP
jgi:hypothetical protein